MDAVALMFDRECAPMTTEQTLRAELALKVLQTFPRHDRIFDGAMSVFANPQDLGERRPHCVPEALKSRVSAAMLAADGWGYGFPGVTRLNLARELGPRDPKIVGDVATAAFQTGPIPDIAFADVRPHARSVLASFGVEAAPWRKQALSAMSAEDSIGTGAAQVAAASRDPTAVAAVAQLLKNKLAERPDGAVTRSSAKRLVELAYAIGAAGPSGRAHVPLLVQLLDRDVQTAAPPFGVIERSPSEVCRALARIGGEEAEQALRGERCRFKPWPLLPS